MRTLQPQQQAEAFVAALDGAVPGRVAGLYLVGSAALGDWQDKVSNLDVVVVADEAWAAQDLAVATASHRLLGVGDEEPRVLYTTYEALAGAAPGEAARTYVGGQAAAAAELDTPMTRAVLAEDAVAVRGSEWFGLGDNDPDAVRAWAAAQLRGRWAEWLRHGRRPGGHWRRKPLAEDLLEVTRLHVAASRGQVVSKDRSAALVLDDVSTKFERVVGDAVGFRRGSRTSLYWGPAERKGHAMELVEVLVASAGA